ncbi:MAG: hypothetical protein RBS28_08435 [Rhodocyclaceae bacterium]|jgi:hypothetical protein|nr:hypothetical protein [Rhodocyclaceae bacterium]
MGGKGFSGFLLTLAVLCMGSVQAEAGDFSLRGFGTVGLARSSSDHAEFVRDLSQPLGIKGGEWSGRIDSVLGLQASWRATDDLEFVGQAIARLRYDRSRDPEVMWAFAKWEPDARVSLRAGRIGADFMMLADSRLVGYSYLPARPSADFFGPLFFSHFDGADASLTLPLAGGLVRGKLFAGETREKTSGAPGIWDTSGSPVAGMVLDYLQGPWLFRANYAQIRFSSDINFAPLPFILRNVIGTPQAIAAADALVTKDTKTRFYSLGIVYDDGPLQVQGMLNTIDQETGVFQNSSAGYLLAGYRFGMLTPYAGVSWWKSKFKPFGVGLGIPDLDRIMAASGSDQTTYTLGARWDFHDNMALKLQWDAIRGSPQSLFPYARANGGSGWNGRTDVLSVVMDFVF